MLINEKIADLQRSLPPQVTLVAISKTHLKEMIRQAYDAGQRIFGENRPQEMKAKHDSLPEDIRWQMIGHLQTNKVRLIASFVDLIHSVDSARLLELINSEAERCSRTINVLMEVHIAKEESKHGWQESQLTEYFDSGAHRSLTHIHICGLMGVATYTEDMGVVRSEFGHLRELFDGYKCNYFASTPYFNTLSMGMSSDYELAIECGSTMVRLGSLIFGIRDYK